MKAKTYYLIAFIVLFAGGCVKQFVPVIEEKDELVVVEGIITDQPGISSFTLSRSQPLWKKSQAIPLKKCLVWITDNLGNADSLKETKNGVYVTDSAEFRGIEGREYTLHIKTAAAYGGRNYISAPVMMNPVPTVDTIYYEKRNFVYNDENYEGCEIFLDTHDPANSCRFFRWSFDETWEFRIPYELALNRVCWISGKSENIMIKSTAGLAESVIRRYPVFLISDPIDRLTVKYSILINQYSIDEDEYFYWESLKNALEEVGGLYDFVPANIPNNIYCVDDPEEKVLGYFSVSSVKSKRLFIQDNFIGINHLYDDCPTDIVYGTGPISGLNIFVWLLYSGISEDPPYTPFRVLSDKKRCGDCTTRGTTIKPAFWK